MSHLSNYHYSLRERSNYYEDHFDEDHSESDDSSTINYNKKHKNKKHKNNKYQNNKYNKKNKKNDPLVIINITIPYNYITISVL